MIKIIFCIPVVERNEYEVDGIHDYIERSYIRRFFMDRILAVEAAGMTDKDTIVDIEDEAKRSQILYKMFVCLF